MSKKIESTLERIIFCKPLIIHVVFLLSARMLAYSEKVLHQKQH